MRCAHRLVVLAVAVLVAGAGMTTAAASAATSSGGRPHSRIVTYAGKGVRVQRLEATVRRVEHRLRVHVWLQVRNDTGGMLTRYLIAGRCVSGSGYAPSCPATTVVAVTLAVGETKDLERSLQLRQPPPNVDSVEIAFVEKPHAPGLYARRADGELLLRGQAWRATSAGIAYGVRFPAADDRAQRLNFDIPLVAPGQAYIDAKWTGTAAPGAPTTIARCSDARCAAQTLKPARARSGLQLFANRFDYQIGSGDAVQLTATSADGTPLLTATLPWPG
jgi:hypothetical protein